MSRVCQHPDFFWKVITLTASRMVVVSQRLVTRNCLDADWWHLANFECAVMGKKESKGLVNGKQRTLKMQ